MKFDLNNEAILDSLKLTLERDGLKDIYIDEDYIDNTNAISFCISYFDHFLSENEYIKQDFVCYSDKQNLVSQNQKSSLELCLNRFLSMYIEIFNLNNGMIYIDANSSIKITDNICCYSRCIINGLKERPLCTIVFPNIKTTVIFGYDLTHQFFTFDCEAAESIKAIARNQFLNILQ